jgi:hypothetical protein
MKIKLSVDEIKEKYFIVGLTNFLKAVDCAGKKLKFLPLATHLKCEFFQVLDLSLC